jgi:myo-inositol-1(or 4)-monophosphatase
MASKLLSLVEDVKKIALEAGEYMMQERNRFSQEKVESKGLHDYVSYVDKTSEIMIVEGLEKLLPDSGFIAEEGTSEKHGEHYNWIIDPLDGTTNYIHGLPPFCVSIALQENNEIVLGVIYEPNLKELFWAVKGKGAFMNEKAIQVSATPDLDNALLATGFPYYDYSKLQPYMKLFEWCMIHTRGVRRLGSAAVDLAYVACGRMDGFFEYGLRPWDVAAGMLLVEEAGGKVSDFDGQNNALFGKEILAFNASTHQPFLEISQSFLK